MAPSPCSKQALQKLAVFSETVAMHSASKLGYDLVEIRRTSGSSSGGKWVPIQNHLTLNWYKLVDGNKDEMRKHGELFVDDDNTRLLSDAEIDASTKKLHPTADSVNANPHTWGA
ncbi:hypothetical protein LTR35_000983 [Friedmanniomyces endolithicus]|nr:hypothetical protein LTS00_013141 [Friedmanniomyces endolithicus]KAK0292952.1 hypothetical protein LTR35_000983 [Friedmanniomyces endolithicus]